MNPSATPPGDGLPVAKNWTDRTVGNLDGRVAVITGSSRGIGEAIARRYAAAGAAVVVNSSQSHEAGQDVAADLPRAIYARADVSKVSGAEALIDAAEAAFGGIDILVNCAGWSRVAPFEDLEAADDALWRRCLGVHVMGVWNVSRAAVPMLKRSDAASVTNITSIAASTVSGSSIPYSVSKAGADHLTRLLARALAPGIRVNAVAPGFIRTPLTASMPAEYIASYEERIPVGHGGEPADIAEACLYLATCEFVTGTVLSVDGGVRVR